MYRLRRAQVIAAKVSPWDVANGVLYALCRRYPSHDAVDTVIAKVMLIGRTYAAAIERRKTKRVAEASDAFYLETVGPTIVKSGIDRWLGAARSVRPGTESGFEALIDVHARTTELFSKISGLQKRSLASKYLHFHVRRLFFIYDSRAASAVSTLGYLLPRASAGSGAGDNEYRKFAEKCVHLLRHCEQEFGVSLDPRQLDNLLLRVSER